jgi:glucose/arabinose dehydrogenase
MESAHPERLSVVFVPFRNGLPAGEPTSFFSGFVPDLAGKDVYGRMVGVAMQPDGSLLVSDDGGKLIWRISYKSENRAINLVDNPAEGR